MNRFVAFLIHLGISLLIFAVLAYVVLFVWYPDFFFAADGGWQGMRIIVFVDLVLGPTLTLVVFNRTKPRAELRRDLSMIAAFQLVCLSAGSYVVYQSRPIAMVYVDGSFYSMTAGAYEEMGVAVPDLSDYPGPWPKRVYVELPSDFTEQSAVRRDAMLERHLPLRALTERYVPLTFDELDFDKEGMKPHALRNALKHPAPLDHWLADHDTNDRDYAFFKFATRYGYGWVAVSRQSRDFEGFFWPYGNAAA